MTGGDRTLVVGGSVGGAAMIRALRQHGHTGPITLIGQEKHLPYDRPPLSKQFLTGAVTADDLALLSPAQATDLAVDIHTGVQAAALDTDRRIVTASDGLEFTYSNLVIATGVHARSLAETTDIGGVHTLRTIDDALALKAHLRPGSVLLVVGAGFVGLEVAATARELGIEVHVVEPAAQPLASRVPDYVSSFVETLHASHGVRFHFGTSVATWHSQGGSLAGVTLTDGSQLQADVAVVAIGTVPNTAWLQGSRGIELGNGVHCTDRNQAADHVFAIGDVAAVFDPAGGAHRRIEHRMTVNTHADRVARVLTGQSLVPEPPAFFWTDQYKAKIQSFGQHSPDSTFELIDADPEALKFVGVARRAGSVQSIVGSNSAGRLTRLRRELFAA